MIKHSMLLVSPLVILMLLMSSQARSGDGHQHKKHQHRQHDAHQHGVATMNVAIDSNQLHIEFESPAMNIVGFEHAARTQKQKRAVVQANQVLNNAKALFILPVAANCRLLKSEVESPLLQKTHKKSHGEFQASYVFQCENINQLKTVDVQLFNKFKATKEIRVQLISAVGQMVKVLTAQQHKLDLK